MSVLKAVFGIGFVVAIIAGIIGWGMNVGKLIALLGDPVGSWLIGRAIGILVAPLGAILGYL